MSKYPTQLAPDEGDAVTKEAPTNLAVPPSPAAPGPEGKPAPAAKVATTSPPAAVAATPAAPGTTGGEAPAKGEPTPTDPAPPKVDFAAEVMKRRDAKELAQVVREKKAVEAERAKLKEHEQKLESFRIVEQLLEDGDDAGAIEALIRLKAGDKASERLASTYNALTERMLKAQDGKKQEPTPVERDVSRLRQRLEALEQQKASAEAKLAEKEAAEHEQRVQNAIGQVGTYLKDAEHEYPYLMAEADDPGEVVWHILDEAAKHGQELTIGDAAKLANDHFQPTVTKKADRYKNLLAPTKANGVPPKPEALRSQSAPPRKSLTNADASQAPSTKTLPPAKNDEERLARGFAVLQRGLNKL
jgi:hypothetical protein